MKIELKLNADGRQWDVVNAGLIVSAHATIKLAMDARFDLQSRNPRTVIAFRQDGSAITKRIRRVA